MNLRRIAAPAAGLSLVLVAALAAPPPLGGQTGQISGTVTDSSTGHPVAGADVLVVGTFHRTRTMDNGSYTVAGVPSGTYAVEARRLGYVARRQAAVEVAAGGTATADFQLMPSVFRLQEVVVTGTVGETEGVKLPFAVGRLDAEQTPVPSSNALEVIQGKVAGVTVVPSGQPGSGTNIQLRTPTSINRANSPLIVVDGVMLGTAEGIEGSSTDGSADLNGLDIERIEIVKGAAAASLYGSRAQAGVIQVWTRRGRDLAEGQTRMTLRSEVGLNSLGNKIKWARYHPYLMDAAQTTYVDALGNPVPRDQRVAESLTGSGHRFQDNPFPGPFHDQVDVFFDPGGYYTNALTLAHRTRSTNWFASLGQHRSDGVIDGHGYFRRHDVRFNFDHRLREDLTLTASGYYARSVRDEMDVDDTFFDLIQIAPDADLRQPDPDGTPFAFQPDPLGIRSNPLYRLVTESNWTSRNRFLGNMALRYTPNAWLSVEGNLSFDRLDEFEFYFLDRGIKTDNNPTGGLGLVQNNTDQADALNASLSVSLSRQVGQVTSLTTFRALMESEDLWETTAEGEDLVVSGVPDLNNARVRDVASRNLSIRANGFFMITGLDYAGKYVLDGLVRRDGSSLFGPAERWHTYGRVSGAYRVAQEPWWPIAAISEFKLRVSRGTAGGRPNFADHFETYDIDPAGNLTKDNLGNSTLKPERSTETEYGLDVIALDRFSLQYTYARRTVRDQLIQVPLASIYGFPTQWQNAGTVFGITHEATLEAQVISKGAVDWRLGVVFDRNRHWITEFNRPCFRTGLALRCVGEQLGVFYGHRFVRSPNQLPAVHANSRDQFQVNDDGLLVPVGPGASYKDMLWGTTVTIDGINYAWGTPFRQLNPNGSLAIVRIGNSTPDFHLGFSSELRWKNFSVYGLVDLQAGGEVYHNTKQRMYQWWRSADEDQSGKPDSLKKPINYYELLYNAANTVDWFVEPGGFVKLRELAVRYSVPVERIGGLRALGVRAATLALVGRNLLTFTDYSGYDPEVTDGVSNLGATVRDDDFVYPRYRTITASLQLEF